MEEDNERRDRHGQGRWREALVTALKCTVFLQNIQPAVAALIDGKQHRPRSFRDAT